MYLNKTSGLFNNILGNLLKYKREGKALYKPAYMVRGVEVEHDRLESSFVSRTCKSQR